MTKPITLPLLIALCALTMVAQAQIPNPGFENWENSHTPTDWFTNNVGIMNWITISQTGTGEGHSGSYAMRGEVITAATVPYPPVAFTGRFPLTERYATLTGWYKFSPINGDLLSVSVAMYGASVAGEGALDIAESASEFTQFSVPINYVGSGNPDSASIVLEILRRDTLDLNPGSFFILDDLAFGTVSSVPEASISQMVPVGFSLHQNYPNPFNSTTTIRYDVSQAAPVELTVYDMLGQKVANLASGPHLAGSYTVTWNAANFPSGIYLYRMNSGAYSQTQKMTLVK